MYTPLSQLRRSTVNTPVRHICLVMHEHFPASYTGSRGGKKKEEKKEEESEKEKKKLIQKAKAKLKLLRYVLTHIFKM